MSRVEETISSAALFQLAEVGFLACDMGLPEQALVIFSGLAFVQPDIPHPVIHQAVVHARYGRVDQAVELLLGLQERFHDSPIVKAMLGMLFVQQEDLRAMALLDEVLEDGTDAEAVAVARTCHALARSQQESYLPHPSMEALQYFRNAKLVDQPDEFNGFVSKNRTVPSPL